MKNCKNKAGAMSVLGAALLFAQGVMAEQEPMYVFGDSLSDAGNVYQLTGEVAQKPFEPVPAAPYARGGHHFSDGKTWAEQFATEIGRGKGGKASLKGNGGNGNYAFGGARARPAGTSPSSDVQIAMYLQEHGAADPDALYVIQFGGNDIRDALQMGPVNGPPLVLEAVGSIGIAIQTLYHAGAREFLVVNAPNLGKTPLAAMLGAGPQAEAVSQFFNATLESGFAPFGIPGLAQLEASLPGSILHRLDLFGLINDLVAYPEDFGFAEILAPCLTFGTVARAYCANPHQYLFWDAIHPTSAGHAIVAAEAVAVMSGY